MANLVAKFITSLLLVLCAWMLLRLVQVSIELTSPPNEDEYTKSSPNTTSSLLISSENAVDLQHIKNAHLFGEKERQKTVAVKRVYSPPKKLPRLDIKLVGVLSGLKDSKVAIISRQGKQRSYLIGESINTSLGSVTVVDVFKESVIIERNGAKEVIRLSQRNSSRKTVVEGSAPSSASFDLREDKFTSLLGDVKSTLAKRPLFLSKFFKVQAVSAEKGLVGYRLGAGVDARVFELLGLQSEDVLVKINGQPISTLSLNSVSMLLEASDEVELTLQRGSSPFSLTLVI